MSPAYFLSCLYFVFLLSIYYDVYIYGKLILDMWVRIGSQKPMLVVRGDQMQTRWFGTDATYHCSQYQSLDPLFRATFIWLEYCCALTNRQTNNFLWLLSTNIWAKLFYPRILPWFRCWDSVSSGEVSNKYMDQVILPRNPPTIRMLRFFVFPRSIILRLCGMQFYSSDCCFRFYWCVNTK